MNSLNFLEDLFKAFNKLIAACKKREADLLLIAGDLFEDEFFKERKKKWENIL